MRIIIVFFLTTLIGLFLYKDLQLFDLNNNYTYQGRKLKYSKNFFTLLGYIDCNKIDKKIEKNFDLELKNNQNYYKIGPFNKKIFGFFLQKNNNQYYCKNFMPIEGLFENEVQLEEKRYFSLLDEIKKDF